MKRKLLIAMLAGLLSTVFAVFSAAADDDNGSETTSTETNQDC
jgi:hypothetical protein